MTALAATKQLLTIFNSRQTQELTLYELGALIVVGGKAAGFDVRTEHHQLITIPAQGGVTRTGMLDVVWLKPRDSKSVTVAWEIDARDVGDAHLRGKHNSDGSIKTLGNIRKLLATRAPRKIQALYSIRGTPLSDKQTRVQACVGKHGIEVWSDIEIVKGKLISLISEL